MTQFEFDKIIKNNTAKKVGADKFRTDKYSNYYTDSEFEKFISNINVVYKGDELNYHGTVPPKMASVASSSRFCYIALNEGAAALGGTGEVVFEKSCCIKGIKGGTPPQLDAYIENENIYVEAKCHEIFCDSNKKMSKQYWKYIYSDMGFGLKSDAGEPEKEFDVPSEEFGLNGKSMFDIKQFLCHLLGIASSADKNATLVYMFFRPVADNDKDNNQLDTVFATLKGEITSVFTNQYVRKFCKRNKIGLKAIAMHSDVMEPLTQKNINMLYEVSN